MAQSKCLPVAQSSAATVGKQELLCRDLGVSAADAALLSYLDELCPEIISVVSASEAEWVTVQADDGEECFDSAAAVDDQWIMVDAASLQIARCEPGSSDALAEAASVASGVERELRWYFEERDARLLGGRHDPVGRPCARTVFARRLQRYAASSLRCADLPALQAWCLYLQRVVDNRVFSSSNWLWPSTFERSLEACLVKLEGLRCKLEGKGGASSVACRLTPTSVTNAMRRRETAPGGASSAPALERFVLWRQLARVNQALGDVQARCPGVPGLTQVMRLNGWTASIVLGAACLELVGQLAVEAQSYAAGEIDGHTLIEDILVASGSTAAFALGRCISAAFMVDDHWARIMADQLGPCCAALLMGVLLRTAGRELSGGPRMCALRNAYSSLGLSPSGAIAYGTNEIEAQLEWRLRKNVSQKEALLLWAAYAYIREHQHPELADPWHHVGQALGTRAILDNQAACEVLRLDPSSSFTAGDLRRQYLRLSLVHHPDKPSGDHQTYLDLHGAYEHLRAVTPDD